MTIFKEGVKAWEAALAFGKLILLIGGPAVALGVLYNDFIDKHYVGFGEWKFRNNKINQK